MQNDLNDVSEFYSRLLNKRQPTGPERMSVNVRLRFNGKLNGKNNLFSKTAQPPGRRTLPKSSDFNKIFW